MEEFVRRLMAINLFTTTTMFGATFLLSALPLIILVSALASQHVEEGLAEHLGLNARATQIVSQLFRHSAQHSTSAMVLALLVACAGSVGLAQLVQASYEQIFDQSHLRRGNVIRWLLWSLTLCGWLAVDILVNAATRSLGLRGLGVDAVASLAATVAFFWWSMHLLLRGQVPWRRLLVPAVVTAVLWMGLEGLGALYFSSTITSDSRLYGVIGVVFSLLTWFIAIDVVVVVGALAGDVGQSRWHRPASPAVPEPDEPRDEAAPDDRETDPDHPLVLPSTPPEIDSTAPGRGSESADLGVLSGE